MGVLASSLASVAAAGTTVVLPVEIVGESGTTSSVVVEVPARRAREVRALWIQIHGVSFADMVSVQVNKSVWFSLNNDTVAVAEPGKSYGGIGGGFSTLKVTLELPADVVVEGINTIRFRFNKSDGVVSGFRVVAFNLLTGDSRTVLEPDAFTQEDPDRWPIPLPDRASVFVAAEVDPELIRQLQKWGASYTATAARFQYSPGTARSKEPGSTKSGGK